ncbi:MAG: hypothetical protein ACOX6J_01760 [Oscillospiraceae bacterium]|jgi:hypothetical protein
MKISVFGYPYSGSEKAAEKLSKLFGYEITSPEEAAMETIWEEDGPWLVHGIGEYEDFDKQLHASDMCLMLAPSSFKCAVGALKAHAGFGRAMQALFLDRKGPVGLIIRDVGQDYDSKFITIRSKRQWDDFMKGAAKMAGKTPKKKPEPEPAPEAEAEEEDSQA